MKKIAIFILAFISIEMYAQIPTSGLIGHWPMNDTYNADDLTTNANDGIISGPTLGNDRFGNSDEAYYFDGVNDSISINHISAYADATMTVCFWFKITDNLEVTGGGQVNQMGLITKPASAAPGAKRRQFEVDVNQSPGTTPPYYLVGITSESDFSGNNQVAEATPTIVPDKWYFVAYVMNGNTSLSLYRDGVKIDEIVSPTNGSYTNTYDILIGANFERASARYLEGAFDDLRIYDRVLDDCEILNLFLENYPLDELFPVEGAELMRQQVDYKSLTSSEDETSDENVLVINTKTDETGIEKINAVKVYPNPARDQVVLDFGDVELMKGHKVRITNSLGAVIYESTITSQMDNVDVESMGGAGSYFIYLMDENNNKVGEAGKLLIVQ